MVKNLGLEVKNLEKGLYIPNVDACWLVKGFLEEGNYILNNDYLSKILNGKIDYSYELVDNKAFIDGIEVLEHKNKQYTKDVVNVTYNKKLVFKSLYIAKDGVEIVSNGKELITIQEIELFYDKDLTKKVYLFDKNGDERVSKSGAKVIKKIKEDEVLEIYETGDNYYKIKLLDKNRLQLNAKQLRNITYKQGFVMDNIQFSNWKRSSGKARVGDCMFIREDLVEECLSWARMDLEFKGNVDIASIRAYESLPLSSIIGTINLDPKNILMIDDFDSKFMAEMSVTRLKGGSAVTTTEKVEESNSIWDGQGLMDISVFNENEFINAKGFVLLRNRFFKCAAFNCNVQKWFIDNNIEEVTDMYGNKMLAKDVKLITTPSSLKLKKFNKQVLQLEKYQKFGDGAWLEYYKDKATPVFGVCKYEKRSHWDKGKSNRLSYQMVNTIAFRKSELEELLQDEIVYINKLKNDLDFFIENAMKVKEFNIEDIAEKSEISFGNDMDVTNAFVKMVTKNKDFAKTVVFKNYRKKMIDSYIDMLKKGKIKITNADYCTVCSNPIEMLKAAIGEWDYKTLTLEGYQVHCRRFNNGEQLAAFRNPHVTFGNIGKPVNKIASPIAKYMNDTNNIVFINCMQIPIQSLYNGIDMDSDSILITNNKIVVNACSRVDYNVTPIPCNKIENTGKNDAELIGENMARIDHVISANFIGQVINTSQELNSLYNHRKIEGADEKELEEIYSKVSLLASISNCEIDKAKKQFEDLNVIAEIKLCKQGLEKTKGDGKRRILPLFYKIIGDNSAKENRSKTEDNRLQKEKDTAIKQYITSYNDKNDTYITIENIYNAKGKIVAEHNDLAKKIKKVEVEHRTWIEERYKEMETPMDWLQGMLVTGIERKKQDGTITARELIKENKHTATKDKEIVAIIKKLDEDIKANRTANKDKKTKYLDDIQLKQEAVDKIRAIKGTKADIYKCLMSCLNTKKAEKSKKTKRNVKVIEKTGIENLTLNILFETFGDKLLSMFIEKV